MFTHHFIFSSRTFIYLFALFVYFYIVSLTLLLQKISKCNFNIIIFIQYKKMRDNPQKQHPTHILV
jgi:hypothetical protein